MNEIDFITVPSEMSTVIKFKKSSTITRFMTMLIWTNC